jgi:pyruvate dehydrogenase E2 component (dihydrolipoamide acetyltransferase)
MPKFEMTQETGKVLAWLKNEGQMVEKGEPLLEVETDKVNQEVEAPASGILASIVAQPGQVVPIATPIAYILKPGETLAQSAGSALSSSVGTAGALAGASAPAEPKAAANGNAADDDSHSAIAGRATPLAIRLAESNGVDLSKVAGSGPLGRITREDVEAAIAAAAAPLANGKVAAVPAARRLAKELGVDLGTVKGTGPEGRIQSADVARAAAAAEAAVASAAPAPQAAAPVETPAPILTPNGLTARRVIPLTNIRKTIAERMTASVREAPQFTVSVDVDMRRALMVVEDLKTPQAGTTKGDKPKVTLTAVIVKACAWALRQHPEVNASFLGESGGIAEWNEVNIGVATAIDSPTGGGLIVPVVKAADTLGLRSIAAQLADLSGRAREGKLKIDDLQGGTFTVSNLGMFGIDRFEAILNPPQAAILAVGRVAKRAIVVEGEGSDDRVEIRPMAALTLTSDHRALDGASAARFLATLKKVLEHPGLFLE